MKAEVLTQERANQLFSYDAATGLLTWKVRRGSRMPGHRAGTPHPNKRDGKCYLDVMVDNQTLKVHRVIWLMLHGVIPEQIDHIDGNGSNNRIENLRAVTRYENQQNKRRLRSNKSGCSGVYLDRRTTTWKCQINHRGKRIYLGRFKTLENAVNARREAERQFGFHPNHGQDRPL